MRRLLLKLIWKFCGYHLPMASFGNGQSWQVFGNATPLWLSISNRRLTSLLYIAGCTQMPQSLQYLQLQTEPNQPWSMYPVRKCEQQQQQMRVQNYLWSWIPAYKNMVCRVRLSHRLRIWQRNVLPSRPTLDSVTTRLAPVCALMRAVSAVLSFEQIVMTASERAGMLFKLLISLVTSSMSSLYMPSTISKGIRGAQAWSRETGL